MTDERWLAIGLDLRLLTTGEGGRRTPVRLDIPFQYRPNWGLVGMPDREQVGAPVFCASSVEVTPGSSARAVIIPLFEGSTAVVANVGSHLRTGGMPARPTRKAPSGQPAEPPRREQGQAVPPVKPGLTDLRRVQREDS